MTSSSLSQSYPDRLSSIDLFAGAGGMSEGFRNAGFDALYANDIEAPAIATFARNHPKTKTSAEDIRHIDASALRIELGLQPGELDVLVGGPPCQGFSTYGQRSSEDSRNQLYVEYLRFIQAFKPKAYVIENVTGMLSMSEGQVVKDIVSRLEAEGYSASVWTLDASLFGVPQKRRRVFITGLASGAEIQRPAETHSKMRLDDRAPSMFEEVPRIVTVADAISDLPELVLKPAETHQALTYTQPPKSHYQKVLRGDQTRLTHHSSKQMLGIRRLRLALMHPGDWGVNIEKRLKGNGLSGDLIESLLGGGESLRDLKGCRKQDVAKEMRLREKLREGHSSFEELAEFMDSQGFANKYRRLSWDGPSHTLVAHMARDCSDFVHPTIDRFISVREAARLQSFPDSYYFEGSQFMQLRHIGNAVPPILAGVVAKAVKGAIIAS
jgi:DNA (cytosine-5)-methyltransferase 1